MKATVLVVADAAGALAIHAALGNTLDVTVTDSVTHARALHSTGAFLVLFATQAVKNELPNATELDASAGTAEIAAAARLAIAEATAAQYAVARADEVGTLPYDEYVELARNAIMRRYLLALLGRHNGSVTDAARGANLKRESVHRLMRRYHINADDFRK